MMFRNWMLIALFFTLTVSLTTVYSAKKDIAAVEEKEVVVLEKNKNNPSYGKNQHPLGDGFSKIASFIGGMLRHYVIKPLSTIIKLVKKFSQHVYDNLAQFLTKSSHMLFKLFETKINLITNIPKKLLSVLITLFPNLEERLKPVKQRMAECRKKFPLDGIKKDVEEVKVCVTPSFNLTIHDQIIIADRSLEILKILDQSIGELENSNQQNRQEKLTKVFKDLMQKGLSSVSDIIAAVVDIKQRVTEMFKCFIGEEGKGLLGDIMVYEKNLMTCLVVSSDGTCQCVAQ